MKKLLLGLTLSTPLFANPSLDILTEGIELLHDERIIVCVDEDCRVLGPGVEIEKKKEHPKQSQATIEKILDRIPVLSGSGTVTVKYEKKNEDGSSEKVEVTVQLEGSTGRE